jgi:hypothetical protein
MAHKLLVWGSAPEFPAHKGRVAYIPVKPYQLSVVFTGIIELILLYYIEV